MSEYQPLPNVGADKKPLTREEALESLREILHQAVWAEKAKDSTFVRWPDMDVLLDHIEHHGFPPPPPPRRAHSFTLKVDGNTFDDMLHLLSHFSAEFRNGKHKAVMGGVDSGGYFFYAENPAMTPDKYMEELTAYLALHRK